MLGSPMKRTFALGITLTACASGAGPRTTSSKSVIAIVNATAIPMDTERVIANATIIIRGDRIVWVGASRDAAIPAEANRADARGAFVLPGLQHELVHMDQILRAFIYRDTVGWRPRLDSLARAIAAAGAWVNPTLAVEELLARAGNRDLRGTSRASRDATVDSATFAWSVRTCQIQEWWPVTVYMTSSRPSSAPASAPSTRLARRPAMLASTWVATGSASLWPGSEQI